ncbi:MAG TPA: hypothetical protein VHK06_07575 [Candidatus Limnocylindria bacterium]|nr:hypothetical protein [Candidatus Limnocylindria bacterium]
MATPRRPDRGAGEYRPDLRPMLVLAALFLLVLAGWVLLSRVILP